MIISTRCEISHSELKGIVEIVCFKLVQRLRHSVSLRAFTCDISTCIYIVAEVWEMFV